MDTSHKANVAWLIGLLLVLAVISAPAATNYPAWWNNVIDTNAPSDFAPATQGQLKWIATNAFVEMESNLPGGAGSYVRDLVSSFAASSNFYTVNLGQLKYVTSRFYDRLMAVGFATSYPWTVTTADDSDFAVANIGQVKNVFNFSLNRVYADSGIMTGCEIRTWWNVASTNVVSPTLRDGGFEESLPNGEFPSSGNWTAYTSGGEAGAVCSSHAAHSGNNGLWSYTGNSSSTSDTFSAPYQTNDTVGGDTWILSSYVRQTSSWVEGTKAFVRLKFLNSLGMDMGMLDSPSMVTNQSQGWTYCSVTGTTSLATYFVRMELMIMKPGVSGVAVMNFDDCYLQKCNGFESNADSANFGAMPEGDRSFRTFAVNTAGWGVFRQNGTVDLSAYTNGYLKFWLKSCASSRVEIASVTGITTNTSVVGGFSNTMVSGAAVWQMKSIAVNSMTNVNLSQISSPFRFTDLGVTNASFVDCVYWVKTP